MTVASIQKNGGQSATLNPVLPFLSNVRAGSFLVALVIQEAAGMPPIPTDSLSNAWEMIGCAEHPSGLAACFFRCRTAKAGATTVTFSTAAPSAYALQEFSGVKADANVGTDFEILQPDGFSFGFATDNGFEAGESVSPNEYCEAFLAVLGNSTITKLDNTWTTVTSLQSATLSFQLLNKTPSTAQYASVQWSIPARMIAVVGSFSLSP